MIAWLETTSAATVGRSTSTASEEYSSYAVTTITETLETTTGTLTSSATSTYVSTLDELVPWYIYSDSETVSANYSGTTIAASYTSWGSVDPDATSNTTSTFAFVRSSVTHIANTNATTTTGDSGPAIGGQGQRLSSSQTVSVQSTWSAQTSTTQTYAATLSTTQSTSSTEVRWTATRPNSTASVSFYSTQISKTAITTVSTDATSTTDATTTSGTQIYYGHENTVFQCRTSDALAEIAWTLPQVYSLTALQLSALKNAGTTATRWTQSKDSAVVSVTKAAISTFASGSPPAQTLTFAAVSQAISYTTTTTQASIRALVFDNAAFPITTTTANSPATIATASVSSVTYLSATTLSTRGGVFNIDENNDGAAIYPTESVVSWINSKSLYTTGNGVITWHEIVDVPSTVAATRLSSVKDNSYKTIDDLDFNTTRQGATLTVADNVTQATFGFSGYKVGTSKGLCADISLGKSFTIDGVSTAFDSRASRVSTIFPDTYSVSGADFNGVLSISGKSVSATFVPTDTLASETTTTATFSAKSGGATGLVGQRNGLVGGTPAGSETFFQKWPFGVFGNTGTATTSKFPTVVSASTAQAVSWFESIVGVCPATQVPTASIISYTVTRNRTALPA